MKRFRLKKYDIVSDKIKAREVRLHFLSDLHGLSFGMDNRFLLNVLKKRHPDVILLGGDMIVGSQPDLWPGVRNLIRELAKDFPIYYAMGNHEQKLTREWNPEEWTPEREKMLTFIKEHTIFLDNESSYCRIRGELLKITGLSLEKTFYRKPLPPRLKKEHMELLLGKQKEESAYRILLAHNPTYGDTYFRWGDDLLLSGHFHGGVIRFNENRGLISPHFHVFPRYCCGRFEQDGQNMIVSAGLGEHTVTLRLHNPRELIEINLKPA